MRSWFAFSQRHRAPDLAFQFPDIAWILMSLQPVERTLREGLVVDLGALATDSGRQDLLFVRHLG